MTIAIVLWFSQVMFVLVAKTVSFFLRKSKAVSSGGTKTKLEERKNVGGGEGKFGMEVKGAESFSLLG